jgi:hypothetical protein
LLTLAAALAPRLECEAFFFDFDTFFAMETFLGYGEGSRRLDRQEHKPPGTQRRPQGLPSRPRPSGRRRLGKPAMICHYSRSALP